MPTVSMGALTCFPPYGMCLSKDSMKIEGMKSKAIQLRSFRC